MTAISQQIFSAQLQNNDVAISTNFFGQHSITISGNLVDLETAQRVHALVALGSLHDVNINTIDGVEANNHIFANVTLIDAKIQEANSSMNLLARILRAFISLFKRNDIEKFFSSAQYEGQAIIGTKDRILSLTSPENRDHFFYYTWQKQKEKIEQILSQSPQENQETQQLRETLHAINTDPIWAERNLRSLPFADLV